MLCFLVVNTFKNRQKNYNSFAVELRVNTPSLKGSALELEHKRQNAKRQNAKFWPKINSEFRVFAQLWSRVLGILCMGHGFNFSIWGIPSSTIRKHP